MRVFFQSHSFIFELHHTKRFRPFLLLCGDSSRRFSPRASSRNSPRPKVTPASFPMRTAPRWRHPLEDPCGGTPVAGPLARKLPWQHSPPPGLPRRADLQPAPPDAPHKPEDHPPQRCHRLMQLLGPLPHKHLPYKHAGADVAHCYSHTKGLRCDPQRRPYAKSPQRVATFPSSSVHPDSSCPTHDCHVLSHQVYPTPSATKPIYTPVPTTRDSIIERRHHCTAIVSAKATIAAAGAPI